MEIKWEIRRVGRFRNYKKGYFPVGYNIVEVEALRHLTIEVAEIGMHKRYVGTGKWHPMDKYYMIWTPGPNDPMCFTWLER